MADALISPQVGGTMWVISAGFIAYCAKKIKQCLNPSIIPLMGILGAFVFASQMINFSIPMTGSSGHIGGGLILAVLLGPYAGFITIASVLTVQALFFADGGLLALGCNIFNLGFFSMFIAYPLIYKKITENKSSSYTTTILASTLAATAGLILGAIGVVVETKLSGITALPFKTFFALMIPIHIAIGIIEGIATGLIITALLKTRPEILSQSCMRPETSAGYSTPIPGSRPVLFTFLLATIITGGIASWFASTYPDGLEWSISRLTGSEEVPPYESAAHQKLEVIQQKFSFMPDYNFKEAETPEGWPAISMGTSLAGIVGSFITLLIAITAGFLLKPSKNRT